MRGTEMTDGSVEPAADERQRLLYILAAATFLVFFQAS